jgi:hypothetical protein
MLVTPDMSWRAQAAVYTAKSARRHFDMLDASKPALRGVRKMFRLRLLAPGWMRVPISPQAKIEIACG